MRWFHVIRPRETMSPRAGFFVRKHPGQEIEAVDLVIAIPFGKRRVFSFNYDTESKVDKPVYWFRLTFYRGDKYRSFGFESRRGVKGQTLP